MLITKFSHALKERTRVIGYIKKRIENAIVPLESDIVLYYNTTTLFQKKEHASGVYNALNNSETVLVNYTNAINNSKTVLVNYTFYHIVYK